MHQIRQRRIIIVPLILCILLFIEGCGNKNTAQSNIDKSIYLSEEALNKKSASDTNSYKFDTAIKGDYCELVEANATLYIQNFKAARAEYKYGKMIFDDYVASISTYIEAGDAIAKVHIDVSNSDIKEAMLSVQRMQERLEVDKKDFEQEDALLKKKAYEIHDSQAQGVAIHEYEESVARHNQDLLNRQTSIQNKSEDIEKMQDAKNITQINAPISGYLKELSVFSQGDEIKNKQIVAIVEPTESNIVTVNNKYNDFHYGKQVDVVITTDTEEFKLTGTVITPSQISVASQTNDKTACIRLDKTVDQLPKRLDIKKILVTVKSKEMQNVVIIKRGSLDEEKAKAYATVVQEDGSFLKKSVIIGGKNKKIYWILKGLSEGEKVVIP